MIDNQRRNEMRIETIKIGVYDDDGELIAEVSAFDDGIAEVFVKTDRHTAESWDDSSQAIREAICKLIVKSF